ncbi:translocon-associated protein subunit alpha-like [Ornithodoros turicata]|uniref:Translocon-associated protein subunit alpha n=1 Tax=Ornithodoros turicata TaxID=34597 RepID=A0A2R5L6P5_9ACAR
MLSRYMLLILLILPIATILRQNAPYAVAEVTVESAVEEEEDDVQVEDTPTAAEQPDSSLTEQEEEDDEEKPLKPSPDGDTYMLFVEPKTFKSKLPAGKEVRFLVGFTNRGEREFVLDTIDASFRYPMDFSFYIQNYSTIGYTKVVKPKQQATLFYSFLVSESLSNRPFGLSVNLMYRDADGHPYLDAVFNETVEIVEVDEGLDGETFFLYVFLAACAVLLVVLGQQFMSSLGKKKPAASKQKVEMGTQNTGDVDYDWLPKETLELSRSPKRSPRQSPKQRRVKRGTGSSGEE